MNCKDLILLIMFILLILIIYNIQKNSLNSPPGKGTLYSETEYFNDSSFSTQALQNLATVYAETSGTVTFNNVRVTGNLDVYGVGNCLPPGTIVAYNSNKAPNGWALCDGSGGTPDLRGRFILGYNNGPEFNGSSIDGGKTIIIKPGDISGAQVGSDLVGVIGNIGGEIMHKMTINEMPSHTHYSRSESCNGSNCPLNGNGFGWNGPYANSRQSDPTGSGNSYNNLPPFYVLTYIIKK